jgi:hypothetical protein
MLPDASKQGCQGMKTKSPKAKAKRERPAVEQLLYSRDQTAHALGDISIATVIRLENAGKLDKVRLAGGNGQVFNKASQVHALAGGDHAE